MGGSTYQLGLGFRKRESFELESWVSALLFRAYFFDRIRDFCRVFEVMLETVGSSAGLVSSFLLCFFEGDGLLLGFMEV